MSDSGSSNLLALKFQPSTITASERPKLGVITGLTRGYLASCDLAAFEIPRENSRSGTYDK